MIKIGGFIVLLKKPDNTPLARGLQYLALSTREQELYVSDNLANVVCFETEVAARTAGEAFVTLYAGTWELSFEVKQVALI